MKTPVWVALFVVFLLALAGIGGGIYFYNLKQKDLNKVKPDYFLTSLELVKYFEKDEAGATAKFVNKILEVSGEIASVKTGENNSLNISLKAGSIFSSVICTFAPESDPGILKEGSQIVIRGECSGFLMDVLLNNCVLIK